MEWKWLSMSDRNKHLLTRASTMQFLPRMRWLNEMQPAVLYGGLHRLTLATAAGRAV